MAVGQWGAQIVRFIISVVIARILSPKDYGLMGMAFVFTYLVAIFGNIGLGQALIQRKQITEEYISTAFWATFIISIIFYALVYPLTPLVSDFYDEPAISLIIRVSAIGFIFGSVSSIQESLLTRDMAFRHLAITIIVSSLIASFTTLICAIAGMGVWSLVAGTLVMNVVRIPLLYHYNKWIPNFYFSWHHFKDLFSFGRNILGFGILSHIARNLDNLLIGKFLGPVALGYYDLSYQIMLRPILQVSTVIAKPLFPALSSVQENKKLVATTYCKVITYISLISFPMMFGLCVVAPEFIWGILGSKWAPAIPLVQILSIVGAMQSIGVTVGPIYKSQNRTDIMLKWSLITTPLVALSFILGIHWGVLGVAISYAVISFILWIVSHLIANGLINLSFTEFGNSLLPAFKGTFLMMGTVVCVKYVLKYYIASNFFLLCASIVLGIIIYLFVIMINKHEDILIIRKFIKKHILEYLPKFL